MERFAKIINDFQPLTIFAKPSILDIWQGFIYAFGLPQNISKKQN